MADWKVSAEEIELFPHPNADKLLIAKVGMYALVVGKDNGYKDGDIVIFAPKRSVLPDDLKGNYTNSETGQSYLVGHNHSRVSSVRLRGELSEGVTVPIPYVLEKLGIGSIPELTIGEDLSEHLGITLYESPVLGFGGCQRGAIGLPIPFGQYSRHDVEGFRINAGEFLDDEPVIVTEKLHGSQIAIIMNLDGEIFISSKGVMGRGNHLPKEEGNLYWRAAHNSGVLDILRAEFSGHFVQAYGELIPAQGAAWSYGTDAAKPTLRIFRLEIDHRRVAYDDDRRVPLSKIWVPFLWSGPFSIEKMIALAKGTETVSGKSLHIREGGVIEPAHPRNARKGWPLYIKTINPKFKESDEEPS